MNGIAGVIYPDVFQLSHMITPMLEALSHRGAMPRDIYTHRNTQLGICGALPVANGAKTAWCICDGAFFNKEQLCKSLAAAGKAVDPQANEGAIALAAYECWGPAFAKHLNGDFAIAIFDVAQGRLLLTRDRLGVKPLYWFYSQKLFLFASEIKALLATGAVPQTLAEDAISAYLYFGFIPQDMTPVKGINKLLPGHYLTLNLNGVMTIDAYWSLSDQYAKRQSVSLHGLCHELDHLLKEAVRCRLPAAPQTPIGCYLSGGLGSATVAYYLKKVAPHHPLEAFTTGYAGWNDDDIDAAREVAAALKIRQNICVLQQEELIGNLSWIVWYLDEPQSVVTSPAVWKMVNLAAGHSSRLFSGMGSDELVLGHSRYTTAEAASSFFATQMRSLMRWAEPMAIPVLRLIWPSLVYRYLRLQRINPRQYEYFERHALFDYEELAQVAPRLVKQFDPVVFLNRFHKLDLVGSTASSLAYLDMKTRLADCYIPLYERISAAQGVAWYSPFFDVHVVDFLSSIAVPEEMTEDESATPLKELIKGVYSKTFIDRPKRTRQSMAAAWVDEEPIHSLFNMLRQGLLVEGGFIMQRWVDDQLTGRRRTDNCFRKLWGLLMLEQWMQLYINRPIGSEVPMPADDTAPLVGEIKP